MILYPSIRLHKTMALVRRFLYHKSLTIGQLDCGFGMVYTHQDAFVANVRNGRKRYTRATLIPSQLAQSMDCFHYVLLAKATRAQ